MSTLIDYIKQEFTNKKLRKDLQEVVEDVDALIPQNESEFVDLQKFGLYPAEECVPFVTEAGTPFYFLDNMAQVPIDEPKEKWMHYGDFRFRQLEILYTMPRMDSVEAHEWLRDNLYMGNMKREKCYGRVDAQKKYEYKSKFRGKQRADWKQIQAEWMKYCLCLKYRDFAAFRKELHSTPLFPVEDATKTNYASNLYWGARLVEVDGKKYYFGCNVLGKLLVQLRENGGKLKYSLPKDMHLFGKPILDI
jgi:hypothetical protein